MLIRLLSFLAASLIFAGCCDNTDLKLAPSLRAWMPYNHHQIIKYKSLAGDTITFKVYLMHYNQQGYDKVCGSYDIETTQATLVAQADTNVQVNIILSFEALISIKTLHKQETGNGLSIQFNSISELYISDPYRDRFLPEAVVNNQKYNQVLHAYGNPVPGAVFAQIYYAKSAGLVGFQDFSENWYYLL